MPPLIGRTTELADLRNAWSRVGQGHPELVVVWGRRRVGKTYLLSHFARDKRAVYFTATRQDGEQHQLRRFAAAIREQLGDPIADLVPEAFTDWESALRFVVRVAAADPLLVVIDEAPRLTTGRAGFADTVSAVWEQRLRDERLMLVLSGSAVSVMEEMLGPQGGLHRRAGVERRLDPFSLNEARAFQPDLPPELFIEAYAACGGYPLHLTRWSASASTADNLAELAFVAGGLLLRDAPDILSEDLDWRGGYERVLAAIAGGARRRSRIAGRAQQRIDYTLDRLRRSGYVRTVRSLGDTGSVDPLYEIADTYLAYWFTVLREDADLIEGGQGSAVRHRTDGRWQTHLARVFEDAARSHVQRLVVDGDLPAGTVVGRWWQDEIVEIDVVALSEDRPVLVGECRWQSRPATSRDLNALRRKALQVGTAADDVRLAFWTRDPGETQAPGPDVVRRYGPADILGE